MGYYGTIIALIAIKTILALSVYIVFFSGQFSMAHTAFFGIGAYTSAILTTMHAVPFIVALMMGGFVCAICGLLLGFPVLRLKGLVLAIATLGFSQVVNVFFLNFNYQVKIGEEIIGPAAGKGFRYILPLTSHEMIFGWVVVFIAFLYLMERSRFGYSLVAIRESEEASAAVGSNVTMLKVAAFAISGFMAGIAGGLYAHLATYISTHDFDFKQAIVAITYVAIGGMETFWGAILGTFFLVGFSESIRFVGEFRLMIYGILMVIVMVLRPKGVIDKDLLGKLRNGLKTGWRIRKTG